eukprot:GHVU01015618.1.p2 GENE.GHVU01015618.1~~GHVU01015618.1.p2  ORF type:complete len:112 (+),score=13.66 GHVU01015618.1:1305-1640(+)
MNPYGYHEWAAAHEEVQESSGGHAWLLPATIPKDILASTLTRLPNKRENSWLKESESINREWEAPLDDSSIDRAQDKWMRREHRIGSSRTRSARDDGAMATATTTLTESDE